ncbi:hypothetical protein [Candidatus Borreliella tachyglossi]|uniref:hypothetical protein n=1 Tax=Candidatus Borreliella tachyglossi TaxID=1964448 RepID=UPI00404176AF
MNIKTEIDYKSIEFETYRAKYLDMVNYDNLKDDNTKKLYDFLIETFYEEFKIAQKVHKNFFWHLNDPNDPEDYKHLESQAKAWGIPIFSFEKEDKEILYKRMTQEGLQFIQWMGTEQQTSEILTTIFGKKDVKWWYSDYHKKDQEFISVEVYRLQETQKQQALEYLDRAIPPYLKIEIINYLLDPTRMKNWAKKYSYNELIANGGAAFITQELQEFVADAILLPHDAFRLDTISPKLQSSSDPKRELIKMVENKKDKKVIILFTTPDAKMPEVNTVIDNFFLRDTAEIYVLKDKKEIYEYEKK